MHFQTAQEVGNAVKQKSKFKLELVPHTETRKCTCIWLMLQRPIDRLDVFKKGLVFNINPNSVKVPDYRFRKATYAIHQ